MLLTLSANSLRSRLTPSKKGRGGSGVGGADGTMALTDLPRFAKEMLGLFGLNISTNMLVGADLARLDALRDAADKASCPCLVLVESEPQALCAESDQVGDGCIDRAIRVVQAAHRLGCNAVAISIAGSDEGDAFELAAERVRRVLATAERLEINLLLAPMKGLTGEPERLTELIKKIGGFRIGTFPDFEAASKSPDPLVYLKRLTPYASAVSASSLGFKPGKSGKKEGGWIHEGFDLVAFAQTVAAVGYQGTLAIDYRGPGDPVEGVKQTKEVLESVLGLEVEEP
jgi:sugar phosphate isomerase/epimerase